MEIEDVDELRNYTREKLKELGLKENVIGRKDYPTASWCYEGRRVTITRRKAHWLGMELPGRWHFTSKEEVDRFIDRYVKPMINEIKEQL